MTNEDLNTQLYEKMFEAQEKFRSWLLCQTPEEILNHTYEYTVREDILLSLEFNNLEDDQAQALLDSPDPLAEIFNRWEHQETSYMDTIWDTVEEHANAAIRKAAIRKGLEKPLTLDELAASATKRSAERNQQGASRSKDAEHVSR